MTVNMDAQNQAELSHRFEAILKVFEYVFTRSFTNSVQSRQARFTSTQTRHELLSVGGMI